MIYLSICIPTKNRVGYLKKTISSILNDGIDKSLFQIVISDNSDDDRTECYAKDLIHHGYNIKYYRNKLHNDYSAFKKGGFSTLFNTAVNNIENKDMLFFTNGELKAKAVEQKCSSLDSFVYNASYLITWSSSFSIWKEELMKLNTSLDEVDEMFPHTSLILQTDGRHYLIIDEVLFENISVVKKGGYNIFYNFCVLFLNMLVESQKDNRISMRTVRKVKANLYFRFVLVWYYRTIIDKRNNYTFDNTNASYNIKKAYGIIGYWGVLIITKSVYVLKTLRSILNN